jgi:hypothetical protein
MELLVRHSIVRAAMDNSVPRADTPLKAFALDRPMFLLMVYMARDVLLLVVNRTALGSRLRLRALARWFLREPKVESRQPGSCDESSGLGSPLRCA